MKLQELKNKIEKIEITYDYDETYCNLYNAVTDYMNETQNWCFEYIFEDIISYDTAEEIAKHELETGGLIRLYYFLGDANLNNSFWSVFRIDDYGNLIDIYKEDLESLKQEILDEIDRQLEEE